MLHTFRSLSAALNAGFHIYQRTAGGYVVRTATPKGWTFAIVRRSAR